MAGGFGLGLAAGGFANAFQRGMEQNSLDQYRMQELKLQQQAQQNAEQRFQMSRIDAVRTEAMKGIDEAVSQLRIAGKEPDEITKTLMPWVEQVATLAKKSGLDPASAVYAPFTAAVARPPATQIMAAEARAKDVFGKEAATAEHMRAQTAQINQVTSELSGFGNTPSQAQPATSAGTTPIGLSAATFNQRFTGGPPTAEAGQPSTGVPSADPGAQYLEQNVPPQFRSEVQAVAEGRARPSTVMARYGGRGGIGSQVYNKFMQWVNDYGMAKGDPYDENRFMNHRIKMLAESTADKTVLTAMTKSREMQSAFIDTANQIGDSLETLAQKVDKTGIPVAERWIRAGKSALAGDPDVTKFNTQMITWRSEVARVIMSNPNLAGQLTDHARREVEAALSDGATYQQVKAANEIVRQEFGFRIKAMDEGIKNIKKRLSVETGAASTEAPSGGGSGVSGMSDDELKRKLGIK